MPTGSFEPILSRDETKVIAKQIIDIASPALQEAVNYSTNLYARCQSSKKGTKEEALPLLALYLHVIQNIDSIEVLISQSCGAPANLILRSAFEAKLSIEYICEKKSNKRAAAWAVKHILDQIEYYKNYIHSDPKGVQFRETWEEDTFGKLIGLPLVSDAPAVIESLREKLNKPIYAEVYADYLQKIKPNRKIPEWYSLHEGPKNIWELSHYLKHGTEYEVLYLSWSKQSHANDTHHLTLPLKDGTSILGPIRNPLHLVNISTGALLIMLESSMLMLKMYRSDEIIHFREWHRREILDKQLQLGHLANSGAKWYEETFMQNT